MATHYKSGRRGPVEIASMRYEHAQRILPHVQSNTAGCWIWQRCRDRGGYGRVRWLNKSALAHRVSYEIFVGEIPAGLELDHICKNPACCNPAHLEPVTGEENNRRSNSWSAVKARTMHCPQGHAYDEKNTHVNARGSRLCRTCNRIRVARIKAERRAIEATFDEPAK